MLDALKVVLFVAALFGLLFGSAGRLDLPWFWAVLVTHTVYMVAMMTMMPADLRRERFHPGGKGQERWFRPGVMAMALAHVVVAGLDVGRYEWTGTVPVGVHAAGFVFYLFGLALAAWAMRANRFFSSEVRLQPERGHHVIRSGPYGFVRHPGYLAGIMICLASGLVLGSAWSVLPMVVAAGLFAARAALEDRYLQANLMGYAEYARATRFRMVPGVW